jgi:hypothetical protein
MFIPATTFNSVIMARSALRRFLLPHHWCNRPRTIVTLFHHVTVLPAGPN